MILTSIILVNFVLITAQHSDYGYCDADSQNCVINKKLIFYDINPYEGFNLRRDVYMRFAIMLAENHKNYKMVDWDLVMPPWYRLYHWRSEASTNQPLPWETFFDVNSLKTYAPVIELYEAFNRISTKTLIIDTLYVLKNFDDPFEGGTFVEKWEVDKESDCRYDGVYSWYSNLTIKETVCVKFQGKISKLWELISIHPNDGNVMFAHGEIPLHDMYGTKLYWDCRKSMKFRTELVQKAKEFITIQFDCMTDKCETYISVHWRRQDFARSRINDVPSLNRTVEQIDNVIKKKLPHIKSIFIASDANTSELKLLVNQLEKLGYRAVNYVPSKEDLHEFKDGGVAIIDQIICSHAAYFIGTHESTFSFRIQEEREILGFDSSTTFNRLCPDKGKCESVSKWTIVN